MLSAIARWQKRPAGKPCEYSILFLIKNTDSIKELSKVYSGPNCSVYAYAEINIKFYTYMPKINMHKPGQLLPNYHQCRSILKTNIYKTQQPKASIFSGFSFSFNPNNEWLLCQFTQHLKFYFNSGAEKRRGF